MKKGLELNTLEYMEQAANDAIATVDKIASETGDNFEKIAAPIRKKVSQRYPVLFLLLATSGVIATSLGLEQVLLQYSIFAQNPLLLLSLGVLILIFTGTLYKKLN
jgi:hypothetical protein